MCIVECLVARVYVGVCSVQSIYCAVFSFKFTVCVCGLCNVLCNFLCVVCSVPFVVHSLQCV